MSKVKKQDQDLTFTECITGIVEWAGEYGVEYIQKFGFTPLWHGFLRALAPVNLAPLQKILAIEDDISELCTMWADDQDCMIKIPIATGPPECRLGILFPDLVPHILRILHNYVTDHGQRVFNKPFIDRLPASPGTYQHFNNKEYYKVLGVARNEKTMHREVMYQALYGSYSFFTREINDFLATVRCPDTGETVLRFKRIGD